MKAKTENAFSSSVGQWWRFSKYEVNGGYIRRAPDDKEPIVYDPWQGWEESRLHQKGKDTGSAVVYQKLLSLVGEIQRIEGATSASELVQATALSLRSRRLLEDWCQEFGLLGVLPHFAIKIVTARLPKPVWLLANTMVGSGRVPLPRPGKNWDPRDTQPSDMIQYEYQRTQKGWRSFEVGNEVEPQALTRHWNDDRLVTEPIDSLARYFPDIAPENPSDYPYPMPFTPRFFLEYAEPVSEFLKAALILRASIVAFGYEPARGKPRIGPENELQPDIDGLVEPVSAIFRSSLVKSAREFRMKWACKSLISSVAMMAMHDHVSRRARTRICKLCRDVFISNSWGADYCSKQHRYRGQKRGL
jgi:hypothetical protein